MDGPQVDDPWNGKMANETATTEKGQEDKGKENQRKYDKDMTLQIELQGTEKVTIMELLKCVRELCGGLMACRYTGENKYEVTMTNAIGKRRLLDGFKIGTTTVLANKLDNDELVVSFLGLPAYITDKEILDKLYEWGVSAVSPIKRRMWPGTNIADWTRYLKVKFNQTVQSLPYSARFMTATGPEYFRVIHDRQVKGCRMCIQPGHILRDCPEFCCHRCGVQGHYARACIKTVRRCELCHNNKENCICNDSYSESNNESDLGAEQAQMSCVESSGEEEAEVSCEDSLEEEEVEMVHTEAQTCEPADVASSLVCEVVDNPTESRKNTRRESSTESPCALQQKKKTDNQETVRAAKAQSASATGTASLSPPHSSKTSSQLPPPSADSDFEMDTSLISKLRKRQMKGKHGKRSQEKQSKKS
ncbi:Gag poly [Solea senegalensis]|uniref:Gag poly n=3 Tax=Solea senegalensis TaxID=28829 RepID=A0AAV6PCX2_SOLSE|nr:Gag poly [Solea senegalensis]